MGSRLGCQKRAATQHRMTLAEYQARTVLEKWCSKGKHWTTRALFGRDRTRDDGLDAHCLTCRHVKVRVSTKGRPSVFKGRRHTAQARAAMSAQRIGRPSKRRGIPHTEEAKRRMSAGSLAAAKRGPDHYAWKRGVAGEQQRDRKSPGYSSWRREVRDRAGGFCEGCQCDHGTGRMHAHHLRGFARHPELRLDPDNGAWLCDCCHAMMHNVLITAEELAAGENGRVR